MPAGKKVNFLTDYQKKYIEENYHNMQTWEICETLGVTKKQVNGHAWNKKLKKDEDFIPLREDSTTSQEDLDFLIENYSQMSQTDLCKKLNWDKNRVLRWGKKLNLSKDSKLVNNIRQLTYEDRKFILENYEKMPTRDIAEKIHKKMETIQSYAYAHGKRKDYNICNRFNYDENKNSLTNKQKKYILDNFSSMTNEEIANNLNLSKEKIRGYGGNRKLTKDLEVKLTRSHYLEECLNKVNNLSYNVFDYLGKETEPKVSEEELYKSKYGKYKVNQDYFSSIDNEWKAYWLGFLYADGCVTLKTYNRGKTKNSLALTLCREDKEHLEKFKDSLQTDNLIKDREVYLKQTEKEYKSSSIIITNRKIVEDLIELDCVPNKTYILKFPKNNIFPKKYMRDFIRGFFDGDGSVSINLEKRSVRCSFTGMKEMIEPLAIFLSKELNIHLPSLTQKEGSKAFTILWGNIYDIEKIYKYLYKGCNIYLDRKLKKFNTLYSLE